jgi:hypothetical protein
LLIKCTSLFFLSKEIKLFEDHDLAVNLLNEGSLFYVNDGVRNHSFQFPVYPSIVALGYYFFGVKSIIAIFINVFFISCSSILIFLFSDLFLTRKGFSYSLMIAKLTSVLIMVYPAINVYAFGAVHPFSFNLFLLILFFLFSELFIQKKIKWFVLALVFGLLMLQRSSLVILVFFLLFELRTTLFLNWKTWLKFLIIASILPLFWMVRNYEKDNVFAMTSTSGKILWKGSLLQSDGSNYIEGDKNYYDYLPLDLKNKLAVSSVKEQDEMFKKAWRENWNEQSNDQVFHYFKKLNSFFFFRSGIGQEYSYHSMMLNLYKLLYLILLIGGGITVFRFPNLIGLLLPFFALGMFQAFFYVETRHRVIYEPILILTFLTLLNSYYFKFKELKL